MEPAMRKLCDTIRETAYDLYGYLQGGHLERVYENGLVHRLRAQGMKVCPQHTLKVHDRDATILGEYCADLYIEDCLIVELKTAKALAQEHVGQLFGYLRAGRIEHGMLINFGPAGLQIKKYIVSRQGFQDERNALSHSNGFDEE